MRNVAGTLAATSYTKAHQANASPRRPMHQAELARQLRRYEFALSAMVCGPAPTLDDWRALSDVVNVLETLRAMGDEGEGVADPQGLIPDAIEALANAGERHLQGLAIRLTAAGIEAVIAAIEALEDAMAGLPHQRIVKAFRATSERVDRLVRTAPVGVTVLSL